MRSPLVTLLVTSLLVILCGCKEHRGTTVKRDACSLVSKEEVESVQEALVNETKSSERLDGVFRVSLCFYTAAEFSKSVCLALIQTDPNQRIRRSPRDFWKEKFGPYNANDKERKGQENTKPDEKKEKGIPPKKIGNLGDDAYWVGNRFGGVLYVLKADAFISVSLGGITEEATKLERSKALAQKALQRL
jgi:hypothetical protein